MNLLTAPKRCTPAPTHARTRQRPVLVRMTHGGICGTDYKIFNGAIPVSYPRIMGHEMAGGSSTPEAAACAPGARRDQSSSTAACASCRIGRPICARETRHQPRHRRRLRRSASSAPAGTRSVCPTRSQPPAPLIQVLTACVHAQRRGRSFQAMVVVYGQRDRAAACSSPGARRRPGDRRHAQRGKRALAESLAPT
jgi:threonine dehydrogenase-like Zn-dependent dehydrogenase